MSEIDDILNGAPEHKQGAYSTKSIATEPTSEIERALQNAPAPARGFGGWARDIAATAVKGAIAVPEAVVGLADIPTGGAVGKFLENEDGALGFRPKQAKEFVNEWHSDATKEAQRKFQEADGLGGKLQSAIENPSVIATAVGESIPSMLAGGVAARGLMAATRLGQMGASGAALAGAAGEGAMMAGSQAESIRQETPDGLLTPSQSALAAGTGLIGGAVGALGGKVAQKLGIGDAETMLAQGANGIGADAVQQSALKSIPKAVVQGAITEGFLEELPQSVAEQVLQNLSLDKDWTDGVDTAAVLGVLSGGAMGGGAAGLSGVMSRGVRKPEQPVQDQKQESPDQNTPSSGIDRIRKEYEARLSELSQQEAGEPQVAQSTPPDGRAILNAQEAAAKYARDAEMAANRAVQSPDDEIFQSTGATVPRSVQMGLNPAAGPMSAAAAAAVDTGAADRVQEQAAMAQAAKASEKIPASELFDRKDAGKRVAHRVTGTMDGRPLTTMVMASSPEDAMATVAKSSPGMVPVSAAPVTEPATPTATTGETTNGTAPTQAVQATPQGSAQQPAVQGVKAPRGILAKKAASDAARAQEAITATEAAPAVRGTGVSGGDQPQPLGALSGYEKAKVVRDAADARVNVASNAMKKYPRGTMGLTPDDVKTTPQWKADKAEMDAAMRDLQNANATIAKNFPNESRAERESKRAAQANVQDQPQGTQDQAATAPVEAAAPARGDAAQAGGVPAARDTAGMENDGVRSRDVMPTGLSKNQADAQQTDQPLPSAQFPQSLSSVQPPVRTDRISSVGVQSQTARNADSGSGEVESTSRNDTNGAGDVQADGVNGALDPKTARSLQEAHKAIGYGVTRKQVEGMIARVEKEIRTGKTNNGGVMASLKDSAILQRRAQLARLQADLALFNDLSTNSQNLNTSAEPAQKTGKSEQVEPRGVLAKMADQKRKAALDRIAKGTAYFGTKAKADEFITKSGIGDTHEVVQAKPGRFEIRVKGEKAPAAVSQPKPEKQPEARTAAAPASQKEPPEPPKRKALLLRAVGQKMAEQGAADQSRDRNTNTARRASMAASADADARKREAMGKTLVNLADAIESGAATKLAGITTKAQVEALEKALVRGMIETDRGLSYVDQQRQKGRAPTEQDVRNARFPKLSWSNGGADSARLLEAIKGKKGSKEVADMLRFGPPRAEQLAALKKLGVSDSVLQSGFGWWNIEMMAEVGRLERAGIKTDEDLRGAIAEYIEYRDGPKKEDPIKAAERKLIGQKVGLDFFPTPKAVADRMVQAAGIEPGMRVLEPSAGNGNLADAAKAVGAKVDAVEVSDALREVLSAKGYELAGRDFLIFEPTEKYDAIIMNPPFSNRLDAEHIQRAFGMLKPGARLVSIAGEGVFNGVDRKAQAFRAWLEEVGASVEKLPAATFKDVQLLATTGANARLIEIEAPQDSTAQVDAPSSKKIAGLSQRRGEDAPAEEASAVQSAIEGKSPVEAAQFVADTGSAAQREVAAMVVKKLQAMQEAGVNLELKVAHRGEQVPQDLIFSRGYTEIGMDEKGADVVVWVNGSDVTSKVGTDYETLLHELVHAATAGAMRHAAFVKDSPYGDALKSLESAAQAIGDYITSRFEQADAGDIELTEFEQDIRAQANNAFTNLDEVVSWALTSREAQGYLDGIPYKSGSLWTRFVRAVRSALGLPADSDTVLSEVLRASEKLMNPQDEGARFMRAFWHKRGIRMGTQQAKGSAVFINRNFARDPAASPSPVGSTAETEDDANFGEAESPVFYSALRREIEGLSTKSAPAVGWNMALQGLVKNGKVKADELEWTGISEWLKLQTGKVSKEDVLAYLDANGVQVTETTLKGNYIGKAPDGDYQVEYSGDAKYSQYTLPGGTNYREVLLTLPESMESIAKQEAHTKKKAALEEERLSVLGKISSLRDEIQSAYAKEIDNSEADYVRQRFQDDIDQAASAALRRNQNSGLTLEDYKDKFRSQWSDDSARFEKYRDSFKSLPKAPERTAENKGKIEALETAKYSMDQRLYAIQRQLDQLARPPRDGYKSSHWDQSNVLAHIRVNDRTDAQGRKTLFVEEIQSDMAQDKRRGKTDFSGPFIDSTDKWLALSLKRIMKMAVDGSYDAVAFVNGEQSAERYDLSKQVNMVKAIKVQGGFDLFFEDQSGRQHDVGVKGAEELPDVVGKELAAKIVNDGGGTYRGVDLKVGGEGMKSFYDRIVPAAVKDVLKKVGGGQMEWVGIAAVENGLTVRPIDSPFGKFVVVDGNGKQVGLYETESEAKAYMAQSAKPQPGFTITDSMREKVAGGLPLFAGSKSKSRGAGTPIDRAVMSMAGDGKSGNEILKYIANASRSPYRRQLAKALIATGANPDVSMGGDLGGGAGFKFLAKYSRKNHEVTLSEAAADRAEQIFLHETTHAATLLALDKRGLFATQMNRLYESAKKQGGADGQYGMKNVGEFVAEAFTNPTFQKALKGMKADSGSLWERFVNIVRRILGMEQRYQDMLSAVLDAGVQVMRENIPLRASRSFRAEDAPAFAGSMKSIPDNQAPGQQGDAANKNAPTSDKSGAFAGLPQGGMQERAVRAVTGSPEPAQSGFEAGSEAKYATAPAHKKDPWFRKKLLDPTGRTSEVKLASQIASLKATTEREAEGKTKLKSSIAKLDLAMNEHYELIQNAHKNKVLNFKPLPLDEFSSKVSLPIYKSGSYGKSKGSEYRLVLINGEPAYAREADHWGVFNTTEVDRFGDRVDVPHDWRLDGVGETKWTDKTRYAGYVLLKDLPGYQSAPDTDGAYFGIADAVEQIGKQAAVKPVVQALNDTFKVRGKLHWWHKTVGTPFNLAERVPEFKRVFNAVQDFINSVSFYGAEAAAMAPKIIPKLESWNDLGKSPIKAEDNKAIASPIFEGTLAWMRDESGKPVKVADMQAAADKLSADDKAQRLLRARKISPEVLAMWRGLPLEQFQSNIETRYTSEMLRPGVVWKDSELRSLFKLNDEQIGLYREFRAATDKSLTDLAMSDILQFAGKDADPIKDQVMGMNLTEGSETVRDYLLSLADSDPDRRSDLIDTANAVIDKANRVQDLMDSGYAPLQRFGRFTVYAKDADGEQLFFGMYEDRWAAARAARQMREQYPDASIETGMMSQEAYKLFQGISPETLEIFGTMLGMDSQADGETNKAFQTYLKLAKSNRSALKRLIERKGISGYSEDASRVLASFIYSNARQTASNLHVGEIMNGVNDIPRDMGDAKDAAMRLARYTMDPQEEAQAIRGLLFAQYLGGSIASAAINALQPAQVTFPYLSQFVGAKKSAVLMKDAVRDALKQKTGDARLDAELKKAEEEGIVSPQEIFQLMAQAQGKATLRAGDDSAAGNAAALASNTLSRVSLGWGKVFSIPEQFNRRTTFIAAYRTALETGEANPYDFAKQAVKETQLVYNKGNRPEWARGAIGALAFTFKTYSISYVELLQRMAASGPEGRRAAMLMLGVLLLMAGAGGAPGVEDLEDVVDGIAQRVFGLNFQSRQKRQEWLAETFGEGAARFIENGVSGLPWSPTDVSGRLGLGNLIPGTGLFVKKDNYGRDVAEIAGPAADMTKRFLEGAGLLLQGEVLKAGEIVSPVAVRNMIQGGRMLATDQYTDTKGRKVIDTTTAEGITKLIGFQPADVARVQEATGTTQRMIVLNKIRESEIADKWAKGLASGDADLVQEARDELARWNKANPESQIRIKIPQIMRRVRSLKEDKATRIARTAPAEIRQDVRRALEQGQ